MIVHRRRREVDVCLFFFVLPAQRPFAPWLKRADLFVSSSRWEGSPLVGVINEAMARLDTLGVPYRWSDIPDGFGRQAFVKDPNGVTIELTEVGAGKA